MKTIATHDGKFHTDEVFAVAILKQVFPKTKIIRTRNPEEFSKSNFRVDVGQKYNFPTGDFDHHQNSFAEKRKNKIPYASAGLVWKHFGKKLTKSQRAFDCIDEKLIQPIDALDSGVQIALKEIIPNYYIGQVTSSFLPVWNKKSRENYDKAFEEAVEFAIGLLKREILIANSIEESEELIKKAISKSKNKNYLVLEENVPWGNYLSEKTKFKFVVTPNSGGFWDVWVISKSSGSFENRKDLPKKWAGLENEKLAEITGVEDAIFCHKNLFIVGAKSKQGAIKLAELALKEK
ncbi:MYG1 family protein [Candidatus Pacearchaeota archaeon]|nr:MYG1 family protein [Candidatus Pacearchaeota archaeon]